MAAAAKGLSASVSLQYIAVHVMTSLASSYPPPCSRDIAVGVRMIKFVPGGQMRS